MSRYKDFDWHLPDASVYGHSWDSAKVALLMDIRDELKQINSTLGCRNTLDIPHHLRRIVEHTKPRPRTTIIGRRLKRIRKSLKTTIRKLKRGLQKRSLR